MKVYISILSLLLFIGCKTLHYKIVLTETIEEATVSFLVITDKPKSTSDVLFRVAAQGTGFDYRYIFWKNKVGKQILRKKDATYKLTSKNDYTLKLSRLDSIILQRVSTISDSLKLDVGQKYFSKSTGFIKFN